MVRVGAFALWWLALFGFWVLLVGTDARLELVGGACATLLAVVLQWGAGRAAAYDVRFPRRKLMVLVRVPWDVIVEFGIVLLALFKRRPGAYRTAPVSGPRLRAGERALVIAGETISPNTLVLDVDDEGNALVHDLDPAHAKAEL
jgi:multisubunit Na+/H+ antiporter MnhE subunit